jgi:hypothetical protein
MRSAACRSSYIPLPSFRMLNRMVLFRSSGSTRTSRDVSYFEDAELDRKKRNSINAVLKHLLVGHDGKPCPGGGRPIVSLAKPLTFRGRPNSSRFAL